MIWKLLLTLAAFLQPGNRLDVSPEHEISPYGSQTAAEKATARAALHGENGDMLFTEDYYGGAGIKDTIFRWPGYPGRGVVSYVIDPSLSSIEPLILRAMDQYNKLTCIKFVPRTNQKDYISLVKGNQGCASYIGMVGKGMQEVYLGAGCEYQGIIVHELGHAIGLYHEHQRSDRDDYITIYEKNIPHGQEHNFKKTDPSKELIFSQYDYQSIMHYGTSGFPFIKRKILPIIVAKNGRHIPELYEKPGLTNSDIITINKLYQCK